MMPIASSIVGNIKRDMRKFWMGFWLVVIFNLAFVGVLTYFVYKEGNIWTTLVIFYLLFGDGCNSVTKYLKKNKL